jgi:hypothetical protein
VLFAKHENPQVKVHEDSIFGVGFVVGQAELGRDKCERCVGLRCCDGDNRGRSSSTEESSRMIQRVLQTAGREGGARKKMGQGSSARVRGRDLVDFHEGLDVVPLHVGPRQARPDRRRAVLGNLWGATCFRHEPLLWPFNGDQVLCSLEWVTCLFRFISASGIGADGPHAAHAARPSISDGARRVLPAGSASAGQARGPQ